MTIEEVKFKTPIDDCHIQWRTEGFWRPGQEVILAPLYAYFLSESFLNRPKTNLSHFQIEKQKKKKKKGKVISSFI